MEKTCYLSPCPLVGTQKPTKIPCAILMKMRHAKPLCAGGLGGMRIKKLPNCESWWKRVCKLTWWISFMQQKASNCIRPNTLVFDNKGRKCFSTFLYKNDLLKEGNHHFLIHQHPLNNKAPQWIPMQVCLSSCPWCHSDISSARISVGLLSRSRRDFAQWKASKCLAQTFLVKSATPVSQN